MHAVAYTLAAFRPEVKRKLIETGLLMPTVQMIFRAGNKQVKEPGDYFTGKGQPSVFDGSNVDAVRMIQMAHDLSAQTIPPMVQLRVIKEDTATPGIDYFEQDYSESLGTTPVVIARIFRSAERSRTMVVSAEDSYDINHRPLTYTWSLLQGDPAKVKITPISRSGSIVRIEVEYPERRPIQPGSPLESNRVDVGVFVNNGVYTSAPGFVTWYSLDNEARTYDDTGKLREIGYGMGDAVVSVHDWPELLGLLSADAPVTLPSSTQPAGEAFLKSQFSSHQLAMLKTTGEEYARAAAAVAAADQKRKDTDAASKAGKWDKASANAAVKAANDAYQAAVAAQEKVLTQPRHGAKQGVRALVESTLNDLAADPNFWKSQASELSDQDRRQMHAVVDDDFKRLIGLGIASRINEWTPIRTGSAPLADRLTRFERAEIKRFNDDLIADVFLHGVATAIWRENFVDSRLTAPKHWRDVYRYDATGQRTGWTRFTPGQPPQEFTTDGFLIIKTDAAGHPTDLQSVKYQREKTGDAPLRELVNSNTN
jgi:hypothetical protein